MPVFSEHPWLLWLCYLIAAMAVAYAIQLQLSLRPGAKPVRGMIVWREDLPELLAARLRALSVTRMTREELSAGEAQNDASAQNEAGARNDAGAQTFRTTDAKGATLDTIVTPELNGFFVQVRRRRGDAPPAPYNSSVRLSATGASIGLRLSPLVPLTYVGLIIVVFTVFGAGWAAWLFALLVAVLFFFTIFNARSVVMEALQSLKSSNLVA